MGATAAGTVGDTGAAERLFSVATHSTLYDKALAIDAPDGIPGLKIALIAIS